jgi:glycosyltransferase involved in cell wall biosynthesis
VHVALLTPTYGAQGGGAGRIVQEVARHLLRQGDLVEVIIHTWEPSFADVARRDGVRVSEFRPAFNGVDYALSVDLWAYLRRRAAQFDLIHVHGYRSVPAIPAMRAAGRPVVFSPYFHVAPVTRLRRITRHAYRQMAGRAIASAELAVCASSAEAATLQASVPALKGRVRIVRPGADGAAIIAAEPFEKTRRTVVTLGPLERGKRIDRIISTLPDLGPEYELVVVGRGPERRSLRAHAVNLGVAQQVRFVGPVEDDELFRWLHTADVVVTMADDAMSGTTLLEAACAGAPVIASDIAAHTEVGAQLGAEMVTLISPQASPLDLADEITFAAARPRVLLDVSEVPCWEDMASQTVELYRTVPSGPTARARLREPAHRG